MYVFFFLIILTAVLVSQLWNRRIYPLRFADLRSCISVILEWSEVNLFSWKCKRSVQLALACGFERIGLAGTFLSNCSCLPSSDVPPAESCSLPTWSRAHSIFSFPYLMYETPFSIGWTFSSRWNGIYASWRGTASFTPHSSWDHDGFSRCDSRGNGNI